MPKVLKNLKIDTIGSVDSPANKHARIALIKRDEGSAPMKTEEGVNFPAEAYAYTPDLNKPSTWKLRLWETPQLKETARQVGMALAALGPGFRGNKVEIPAEDLPAVKRKVLQAWRKVHPDSKAEDIPDVLKKDELQEILDDLVMDEVVEVLGKAGRKISASRLQTLIQAKELLNQIIQEAESSDKESSEDTGVSKTKFKRRKEEKKLADDIITLEQLPEDVKKRLEEIEELRKKAEEAEELRKRVEEAEAIAKAEREERVKKEFISKASQFKALPIKAEEFGIVLKGIAEKAPEEYEKIEAVLKAADEAMAKSVIFDEVGKSGVPVGDTAVAKVDAMVEAMIQKNSGMSRADALARVLSENPQLYSDYRKETSIKI